MTCTESDDEEEIWDEDDDEDEDDDDEDERFFFLCLVDFFFLLKWTCKGIQEFWINLKSGSPICKRKKCLLITFLYAINLLLTRSPSTC